ncbi:hypothetical protein HG536_0C06060 [Torulaspora globosa]|uniref:Zn(2)-C6 fungal-type domain-containing protein n=1 Tax=Torulaspora globosa TaxID=48254 RepID=A0A7G3ZG01_9SACH|nr:uncharacterized protein HG536_0C06060 [Torulaspora globosa]QLL32437.1 hypothetical protein HG536_0C06060 [Torulaspora globosa]
MGLANDSEAMKESTYGGKESDGGNLEGQENEYDIDIRTSTVIQGVPPNDPRILGPVQMESSEDGKTKRNSFACVSCHSLKQKCVPSDPADIYRKPCQRCLKNGKLCKFDLAKRTRKRRRGDPTVSPTAPQVAIKSAGNTSTVDPSIEEAEASRNQQNLPHIWSGIAPPSVDHATIGRLNASSQESIRMPAFTGVGLSSGVSDPASNGGGKERETSQLHLMKPLFKRQLHSLLMYQKGKVGEISSKLEAWAKEWNDVIQEGVSIDGVSDPVSCGIITLQEAEHRFELYKAELASRHKLNYIKFPPDTTVTQLRQQQPTLFSVIMSCVSVIMTSESTTREKNIKLDSFVLNLITDQIFKLNHKTVELIESLLTLCLWYNFPEWSNKTRYHIFNYVCVCLTKELGPNSVNRAFSMFSEEDPSKRLPNIKSPLELYHNSARLILLVYISSLNISIFLRQPIQAKWSSLTERACEEVLNNSGTQELYFPEDDKALVVFAQLNFILEKIHIYLHEMRDQFEYAEINDKHFNHLFEKFQSQLTVIFVQMPKNRPRELSFFYSVEAYLYQYIIGNYINSNPKFSTEQLPLEISEAFQKCYSYCASALEEFLKMTPKLVASLPLFHMSRVIYTVGMLLFKLRYSVVVLPSFQHFGPLTQNAIALVNKVSEVLEQCSKIYEFNSFLYKFQYVVALFAQTYANKVGEVTKLTTRKFTQPFDGHPQASMPGRGNSQIPNSTTNGNYRRSDVVSAYAATAIPSGKDVTFVNADVRPSPSNSSDTINDYLTDVDSLMWGFNVLNEEFWTDIFTNNL